MFSRFDPAAKRVLRGAEQACRNHNHYYVGVGHLLLALLEEHDRAIEARLIANGTTAADVLADLRRAIGTGDERSWDGILITPRIVRLVKSAEDAVGPSATIAPVDLLDAVIRDGGLASELLGSHLGNIETPSRVAR